MSRRRMRIDPITLARQREASDPLRSAWVAANAGSGKTFVLAQRVIRLLLSGTPPGRILCLTFTKAAAAQMAKRVFDRLAEWTHADDETLVAAISEIEGKAPDAKRLAAARRLFAEALETPGGLKIQTIHAFAERLLHQFPFEAEVPGHFEVIDDRASLHLLTEARRQTLSAAAADPNGLGRSLRTVIAAGGEFRFGEALAEFIAKRDRVNRFVAEAGGIDGAIESLGQALRVPAGETSRSVLLQMWSDAALHLGDIQRLEATLAKGGANDRSAAERLALCLRADEDGGRAEAYLGYFTRDKGEFRAVGSLASTRVRALWPGLDDILTAEMRRLEELQNRHRLLSCFEASAAMLRLSVEVSAAYDMEKSRRGLLDFDDLVVKAAGLLSQADAAAWVRYRLDQGLDHVLIDEAQDTSPRQWELVTALAEEFFTGKGAREEMRTLFAVGDEKQSIYSFQGADPVWFGTHRRAFKARAANAALAWSDLRLGLSFRSTNAVLSAVDAVFGAPAARRGVGSVEEWEPHQANRKHDPGLVAVWPPLIAEDTATPEDWQAPLDQLTLTSPEVRLAEKIAATIRSWLSVGAKLDTGMPIRAGGILILTRKRGAVFEATNRAIKRAGLPVAGADRLTLTEHIAVQDLLALGEVMLLPDDDLALAALLKSPLIGLDDTQLFALAQGRPGALRRSLAASGDAAAIRARERIAAWRSAADYGTPHTFYANILGPERGRLHFQRRLGGEAEEVLDEFLAEALAYERVETPSLQGFLAWMKGAATEVKRDADLERDEIRVMTVHGAKGLEADIVFLVDDGSRPVVHAHDPKVLALGDDASAPAGPVVWNIGSNRPPIVEARLQVMRERAAEEYRRLLYVGLTRARDRLYVAGITRRHTDLSGGWHALVWNALKPAATLVGEGADAYLEWRTAQAPDPTAEQMLLELTPAEPALPAWIERTSPSQPGLTDIAPSKATPLFSSAARRHRPAAQRGASPLADERSAMERGRIIHRLLEALPEVATESRAAVGGRFLEAVAAGWTRREREDTLAEVMAVLNQPGFAPVFAPGSRAEIDFVARGQAGTGKTRVSGRIDRIAVGAEAVLLVDYKTNRPFPTAISDVPDAYLGQLRSYAGILAELYPKKSIIAGLLWTGGPLLMPVPRALLTGPMQGAKSA